HFEHPASSPKNTFLPRDQFPPASCGGKLRSAGSVDWVSKFADQGTMNLESASARSRESSSVRNAMVSRGSDDEANEIVRGAGPVWFSASSSAVTCMPSRRVLATLINAVPSTCSGAMERNSKVTFSGGSVASSLEPG